MELISWFAVVLALLGNGIIVRGKPQFMFFAMCICTIANFLLLWYNLYMDLYQLGVLSAVSLIFSTQGIVKWNQWKKGEVK